MKRYPHIALIYVWAREQGGSTRVESPHIQKERSEGSENHWEDRRERSVRETRAGRSGREKGSDWESEIGGIIDDTELNVYTAEWIYKFKTRERERLFKMIEGYYMGLQLRKKRKRERESERERERETSACTVHVCSLSCSCSLRVSLFSDPSLPWNETPGSLSPHPSGLSGLSGLLKVECLAFWQSLWTYTHTHTYIHTSISGLLRLFNWRPYTRLASVCHVFMKDGTRVVRVVRVIPVPSSRHSTDSPKHFHTPSPIPPNRQRRRMAVTMALEEERERESRAGWVRGAAERRWHRSGRRVLARSTPAETHTASHIASHTNYSRDISFLVINFLNMANIYIYLYIYKTIIFKSSGLLGLFRIVLKNTTCVPFRDVRGRRTAWGPLEGEWEWWGRDVRPRMWGRRVEESWLMQSWHRKTSWENNTSWMYHQNRKSNITRER